MFTCCDYCYGSGEIYCGEIYEKIAAHSNTKVAPLQTGTSTDTCLIFDEDAFKNGQGSISPEFKKFCGVSQQFVFSLSALHYTMCSQSTPLSCPEPQHRFLHTRTRRSRYNTLRLI